MSQCWSAVILEWAEQGIGVDLVAGAGQETAAIVTTKIVTVRSNRTAQDKNVTVVQDGIAKLDRASGADTAAVIRQVVTDRAIGDGASA